MKRLGTPAEAPRQIHPPADRSRPKTPGIRSSRHWPRCCAAALPPPPSGHRRSPSLIADRAGIAAMADSTLAAAPASPASDQSSVTPLQARDKAVLMSEASENRAPGPPGCRGQGQLHDLMWRLQYYCGKAWTRAYSTGGVQSWEDIRAGAEEVQAWMGPCVALASTIIDTYTDGSRAMAAAAITIAIKLLSVRCCECAALGGGGVCGAAPRATGGQVRIPRLARARRRDRLRSDGALRGRPDHQAGRGRRVRGVPGRQLALHAPPGGLRQQNTEKPICFQKQPSVFKIHGTRQIHVSLFASLHALRHLNTATLRPFHPRFHAPTPLSCTHPAFMHPPLSTLSISSIAPSGPRWLV